MTPFRGAFSGHSPKTSAGSLFAASADVKFPETGGFAPSATHER